VSEGGDDPEDTKRGVRSGEHEVEPSGETAVTGWGRVESPSRNKRRRITLDLAGPPLALPNAGPPANVVGPLPQMDPPSAELALPDLERLMMGRSSIAGEGVRVSTPQPFALDDGWGRSRETPPNAPPRARASTPPPFNVALAQGVKQSSESHARLAPRSRPPGSTVLDLEGEMIDRYALGDFTGALLAAELVLGKQADHVEAKKCAASCRERLGHLHLSRLGGAMRVPRVAVDGSEVRWLGLDHRAGFLLSRVDGASTIEELVDLSGMARHEALKVLVELMDAGALKF
jgi:hypothetical protein